jgi:hypothetical protein
MRCYAMKNVVKRRQPLRIRNKAYQGRNEGPHTRISFVTTSHEKATHVNNGDTESRQVVLVTHATQRYLKKRVEWFLLTKRVHPLGCGVAGSSLKLHVSASLPEAHHPLPPTTPRVTVHRVSGQGTPFFHISSSSPSHARMIRPRLTCLV